MKNRKIEAHIEKHRGSHHEVNQTLSEQKKTCLVAKVTNSAIRYCLERFLEWHESLLTYGGHAMAWYGSSISIKSVLNQFCISLLQQRHRPPLVMFDSRLFSHSSNQ